MSTLKINRNTKGSEIVQWLNKRRWCKDQETAYYWTGHISGVRKNMIELYDKGVNIVNRFGQKTNTIFPKPGDMWTFTHTFEFYHNGEGFVDSMILEIKSKKG